MIREPLNIWGMVGMNFAQLEAFELPEPDNELFGWTCGFIFV